MKQRRLARSMLTAAVLMVAQVGAHQLRTIFSSGKSGSLNSIRPDSVGTAAYFTKALGKAPLSEVIRLGFIAKKKVLFKCPIRTFHLG